MEVFIILLGGIVLGMTITYFWYKWIPKIKNEHWVDGYNNGIRDYHKAAEWAEEMDEKLNWD